MSSGRPVLGDVAGILCGLVSNVSAFEIFGMVSTVTPYLITPLVLVVSAQNRRMPTFDGVPHRRGESR